MSPDPQDIGPDLLARIGAADPEAVAVLYDRYAPSIYRLSYRLMGEEADAQDVVHDVFVGLPVAIKTFEGRGSFEGWLKRVTTRVALMTLRRRRTGREFTLGWFPSKRTDAEESRAVDRLDLWAALAKLTPALRVVFVLKEVEGYSHGEIAKLLGIRVSASKVRLYRARQRLQAYLRNKT
jgi:RNA polymerase sigma-70 factor, ECF subfamily